MYIEQKIYCLNPIEHYSGTVPAVNLCVKNIIYIYVTLDTVRRIKSAVERYKMEKISRIDVTPENILLLI